MNLLTAMVVSTVNKLKQTCTITVLLADLAWVYGTILLSLTDLSLHDQTAQVVLVEEDFQTVL